MNFKNFTLASLLLFTFANISFAANINITCFKTYTSFDTVSTDTQKVKFNSNASDIFFMQDNALIPYKIFGEDKKVTIPFNVISVSSGKNSELKYINDGNNSTYYSFDALSDNSKTIILDFGSELASNSFQTYFDISHEWAIIYSVSKDNINYSQVSEYNLDSFGFRYLKISFPNYKELRLENSSISNTFIREINFSKKSFTTLLINPLKVWKISIYSGYDCNSDSIKEEVSKYTSLNQKTKFSVDSATKETTINLLPNPWYNSDFDNDGIINSLDNCKFTFNSDQSDIDGDLIGNKCDYDNTSKNPLDSDFDKDWVGDSLDNCKYISNPDQRDSNSDSVWDVCMDDDRDWIIGNLDNCPNISNPDQKDINANNVWDACEFDKDNDGIFDSVDNCINKPNTDQSDIDNDWIWDICDNCKLYNPDQKDENNNWSWDTCEAQEKYEKTHDSDRDTILDYEDNCPKIANVWQEDLDKDWVGNACDNCLSIQNTDQKDEDKSGKWDVCEDVDKDGIDWFKDNCPNIANSDQADSNNDWIGDVCGDEDSDWIINSLDNCVYKYNSDQSDVDSDKKWDVCDPKDDRYVESNKTFFVWILITIVAIFGVAIFAMVKKLRG